MIYVHSIFWGLTVVLGYLFVKIFHIIKEQEEQAKRETFLTKQITETDLNNKQKQEEFEEELNKYKKRVFELEEAYLKVVKKLKDEE